MITCGVADQFQIFEALELRMSLRTRILVLDFEIVEFMEIDSHRCDEKCSSFEVYLVVWIDEVLDLRHLELSHADQS